MGKVLVLMSTYNGEKYLKFQLDSIRKQTIYDNIYILVRDDGSTDRTVDILSDYAKDGHLKYFVGENIGSAKSFHELLKYADRTDFYAFADQDDVWLPNKIETALKWLVKKDVPAAYGCSKNIVDDNLMCTNIEDVYPPQGYLNTMCKVNAVSGCTMVFNHRLREMYLECPKILDTIYHDSYMWKLASTVGEVFFDHGKYILYRQHGDNTVGALKYGKDLFFKRLKKLLMTKEYRKNRLLSQLAFIWYETYNNCIPEDKQRILNELGNVNSSWIMRLKLIRESGLDIFPLYEYFGIKMRIILGWI